MTQEEWDEHFLTMADHAANASKDPSTKVGAFLVDAEKRVVSSGYNGFARGCSDDSSLYTYRHVKYLRVIHAELNAVIFADRKGHTIYITHPPCSNCVAVLIQHGIQRIVFRNREMLPSWFESVHEGERMCREAGVQYDPR